MVFVKQSTVIECNFSKTRLNVRFKLCVFLGFSWHPERVVMLLNNFSAASILLFGTLIDRHALTMTDESSEISSKRVLNLIDFGIWMTGELMDVYGSSNTPV